MEPVRSSCNSSFPKSLISVTSFGHVQGLRTLRFAQNPSVFTRKLLFQIINCIIEVSCFQIRVLCFNCTSKSKLYPLKLFVLLEIRQNSSFTLSTFVLEWPKTSCGGADK